MQRGKEQGIEAPRLMTQQNPLEQMQAKYKELESGFKAWLDKQSVPVEVGVVTATCAAQGAAIGAFMGTLTNDISSTLPTPPQASLDPKAMASFKQAQALSGGPLVQGRNFAVMTGVNAGISCLMKRLRGKEDVQSRFCPRQCTASQCGSCWDAKKASISLFKGNQSWLYRYYVRTVCAWSWSMVAAFGSGAMFSIVSGMGGPNQVANAVSSGLFFALVQGGLFQLGQKFSKPPAEDEYYSRTRSILNSLGLQNYEKNFKKGLLTDSTLPLLTDSALRDVKIPPGPRLLILDHIQRDPELKQKRSSHG